MHYNVYDITVLVCNRPMGIYHVIPTTIVLYNEQFVCNNYY